MTIVITKIEGKCQYEGCEADATAIAIGRVHPLGCFCEAHAMAVSEEGKPEYEVGCPNCGCYFGVN